MKKSRIDKRTEKEKESKHNMKDSHQISREKNKRGKEEKKFLEINLTTNKMALRAYILIISLNVKGLNAQTKRHKLAE